MCETDLRKLTQDIFADGGLSAHTRRKKRLKTLENYEISRRSKNFIGS